MNGEIHKIIYSHTKMKDQTNKIRKNVNKSTVFKKLNLSLLSHLPVEQKIYNFGSLGKSSVGT